LIWTALDFAFSASVVSYLALFLALIWTPFSMAQPKLECRCVPTYGSGINSAITDIYWRIQYSNLDNITNKQKKAFHKAVQEASNRWNKQLRIRGLKVRIREDAANPDLYIEVNSSFQGLASSGFIINDFDIRISPQYVTLENFDSDRVVGDIQHEFGHVMGFKDAGACNDSIMGWDPSDVEHVASDFTDCDIKMMFDANFGKPQLSLSDFIRRPFQK
jgi:hypothetical protein